MVYFVVFFIFKTISYDLFINLKQAVIFSVNPSERERVKREMEFKKKLDLVDSRLSSVERVLFAMNEDVDYLKSNRGIYDMKMLKKLAKR